MVTTLASDHDSYHHQRADQDDNKVVIAIDDLFLLDDGKFPEWVIAESKALSREIILPGSR